MNKKTKLLIITQKVDENDDVLGFFHSWIEEFAKYCEHVTVICLYEGQHHLPKNVKVISLGKEKHFQKRCDLKGEACDGTPTHSLRRSGATEKVRVGVFSQLLVRFQYIAYFYKYIWQERKNYNSVFVHMNPIYIIFGGLFWRICRKKISLWYTHKNIDLKLKVAEKITNVIFSASAKSFRLNSNKLKIMGHGIDTEKFKPKPQNDESKDIFRVITVGRISPVKDYETLISAIEVMTKEGISVNVDVVGDVGTPEQKEYLSRIKVMIKEKNLESFFSFIGSVPNKELSQYLQRSDVFVNMSHTGSLDKAVLEAMSSGVLVVTCNDALQVVLEQNKDKFIFQKGNYIDFAKKIISLKNMDILQKNKLREYLRNIVVEKHNIKNLIQNIVNNLK